MKVTERQVVVRERRIGPLTAGFAAIVCVSLGCASRKNDLQRAGTVSDAPEEVDDDLYRTGRAAYARGDWEEARLALAGFIARECRHPERAVCRTVKFELARATRRSGHPANAALDFEVLLRDAPPGERQAVAAERDEALAAMRSEWTKSKGDHPVLLRFRDQAAGFEAEHAVLYIDGRKVFDTKVPPVSLEGWAPLASISLAEGEHILEARLHFTDRSRGRYILRALSPLEVKTGAVVVEIATVEETTTVAPFASPSLDVIVRQGTSAQPIVAPPPRTAPQTGPPQPIQ